VTHWAVIRDRNITVLLQDKPWAFFKKSDFACLPTEYHPECYTVVVLKLSTNIIDLAADIGPNCRCFLANTPGAAKERTLKKERRGVQQPIYPVEDFEWNAPLGSMVVPTVSERR